MGLLDDFNTSTPNMIDPASYGLLSAGLGILAASPGKPGMAAIGQGGMMGLMNYQGALHELQTRKLRDLQLQTGQLNLDDLKRKTADQEAAHDTLKNYYGAGGLPQGGVSGSGAPVGVTVATPQMNDSQGNAPGSPVQSSQPGVTSKAQIWQKYQDIGNLMAARGLVDQAQQYYGLAEKFRPKFKADSHTVQLPDGRIATVNMSEDGQEVLSGYTPAEKLAFQNTGGQTQALNPYTGKPVATINNSMSPDAAASNKLGWANYGLRKLEVDPMGSLAALSQPGAGKSAGPSAAANVSGAAFLSSLPQAMGDQVKALAEGRMAFPAGFALKSPYWQNMISMVSQYDPNFDAINYNARAKTRADFTSGKNAQNIKALNTAIGHLGTLDEQIGGTAGHSIPLVGQGLNYLENKAAQYSGEPGITNYNQTAGALASELTQVFRGSGGNEADIKRYIDQLNPDASTVQKKAAVKNIVDLLNSRTEAIGDQYNQGMGTTADPLTLLNPKAADVIKRIKGGNPSATPPKNTFNMLPAAAQYQGKRMKADNGTIYRSNGKSWVKE